MFKEILMIKAKHMLTAKFILDIFLGLTASFLAFWLRLGGDLSVFQESMRIYLMVSLPLKAILMNQFRVNKQFWRYSSIQDLTGIIKLCGIFILFQSTLIFLMHTFLRVPRSVPTIDGLLTLFFMGFARLAWRLYHEKTGLSPLPRITRRVLVVGAGEAGTMMSKEMMKHPESGMIPIGFLDDDTTKHHINILGLPVFGELAILPQVVKDEDVSEILIAMPSVPGEVTRNVMDLARKARVPFRTMPGLHELVSGKVTISNIRKVEVEDLLRREPVDLHLEEIADYLDNKTVLITGAGGSIGSELVRQVLNFNPLRVVLLGRGENSLFQVENQLKRDYPEADYRVVISDVRLMDKTRRVFQSCRPQVVFHAAAHKHVPLMENNPDEAIFNNIGGTNNLVQCALEFGAERFVNISTDKAVNPSSIMGASKRVAEMVVRRGAERASPGQAFISVRFGNVLGSRGSVVPMFKEQIQRGGPVTVTHPEMQRYFMTIPEAVQLVLQAGGMNGNGTVYVLDMGKPIKILDLAKDLIRLSGFEPSVDIDIVYSGIRPGEKLFEELLTAEEGTLATKHDKIFFAKNPNLPDHLEDHLEDLFASAHRGDSAAIYRAFEKLVPHCRFNSTSDISMIPKATSAGSGPSMERY